MRSSAAMSDCYEGHDTLEEDHPGSAALRGAGAVEPRGRARPTPSGGTRGFPRSRGSNTTFIPAYSTGVRVEGPAAIGRRRARTVSDRSPNALAFTCSGAATSTRDRNTTTVPSSPSAGRRRLCDPPSRYVVRLVRPPCMVARGSGRGVARQVNADGEIRSAAQSVLRIAETTAPPDADAALPANVSTRSERP